MFSLFRKQPTEIIHRSANRPGWIVALLMAGGAYWLGKRQSKS